LKKYGIHEEHDRDQNVTLLLDMQRQLDKMRRKKEEEISALREENKRMRRQLEETISKYQHITSAEKVEGEDTMWRGHEWTLTNQTSAGTRTLWRLPLLNGIMEAKLPPGWKGLMDYYESNSNLDEHVDVFFMKFELYTSDDVIFCRVFTMSLKGLALSWFTRLPPIP